MALPRRVAVLGGAAALVLCLATTVGPAGAGTRTGATAATVSSTTSAALDGRILFTDFDDGQIYTVNPDGTAPVQVTHLTKDLYAEHGRWSPDSTSIVFDGNLADGANRIFVVLADGSNLHQVGDDTAGVLQLAPDYTPDGEIVYSRCLPDPPGGCAIYQMRADGTHARPLTHYRSGVQRGADFAPQVSPDGHRIVFTRFDSGGYVARVVVMNSDGSHQRTILPARLEAGAATWAPAGDRLVLMDNISHLGSALHLANADGSHLRSLTATRAPHNDGDPAYSPSGYSIAFRSDRGHPAMSARDLRVMGVDGRGDHVVRTGHHLVASIYWGSAPLQTAPAPPSSRAQRLLSPGVRRELTSLADGLPGGLAGGFAVAPGVLRR